MDKQTAVNMHKVQNLCWEWSVLHCTVRPFLRVCLQKIMFAGGGGQMTLNATMRCLPIHEARRLFCLTAGERLQPYACNQGLCSNIYGLQMAGRKHVAVTYFGQPSFAGLMSRSLPVCIFASHEKRPAMDQ